MSDKSKAELDAEEIEALTGAMVTLLGSGIQRRGRSQGGVFSMSEFGDEVRSHSHPPTPAAAVAARIVDDPIWTSVSRSIEAIGIRLNEIGGLNLMGRVLAEACERLNDGGKLECRVDHIWSGIGGWIA